MGADDDGFYLSDDEIEALLRGAAGEATLDKVGDIVEFVVDLRAGVGDPVVGPKLRAWLNSGHRASRLGELQREVLDLTEIIHQLVATH